MVMKYALLTALASLVLFASLTALAAPESDRIRISYDPPKNPIHQAIYEDMRKRQTLEKAQEFLSPYILPRELTIRLAGCDGEADAWYGDDEIILCYEYVNELINNMPDETTPSGVRPIDTLTGPFFDTLLHEFAHALFDMHDIPVLGREEDAADQVAAYIYLQLGPEESRSAFQGTAWVFLSEAVRGDPLPITAYSDEHGTPAQRGYNILCIAYGADTKLFGDIVRNGYLPPERAEFCEEEYEQVQDAYEALIMPHVDQDLADKLLKRSWLRRE